MPCSDNILPYVDTKIVSLWVLTSAEVCAIVLVSKGELGMLLHPDDMQTFKLAKQVAHFLARSEGLLLLTVEPKRRPLEFGALGLCYHTQWRISIAFRWKHRAGNGGQWYKKPLPLKGVLETVAHEVAHLRYPNHGKQFKELENKLVGKLTSTIDKPSSLC
jgi:hypothetical protein